MTTSENRSVQIGGNVTGSAVVTGDGNTVSVQFQQASLPEPESVDIQAELRALRAILAELDDPVVAGGAQKLGQEAAKPASDKNVIAKTLETGLAYAQSLAGFGDAIDRLRPTWKQQRGGWESMATNCCPWWG